MAGVGVGTVSRVVNDPESVSEKLRTRVQQVIKDTNYRPSAAARMLVQQRHQAIGVVAEIEQTRTYYSTGLLQGIALALDPTYTAEEETAHWHGNNARGGHWRRAWDTARTPDGCGRIR